MDNEQYIESGLSVGTMKIANKYEIFTEEEVDAINNKIPELDERVSIIEYEIEDINSSLNDKAKKEDVKNVQQQVNNLVLGAVGDGNNAEVVQARGNNATLNDRITSFENKIIQNTSNLFDYENCEYGKYVNRDSGKLTDATIDGYYASDWITVDENTSYFISHLKSYAFYDSSKSYLSGGGSVVAVTRNEIIVAPENACYLRITSHIDYLENMYINEGVDDKGYSLPKTINDKLMKRYFTKDEVLSIISNYLPKDEALSIISNYLPKEFNDKVINCLGDSITYGYNGSKDGDGVVGERVDKPYPTILSEILNCTVNNYGQNGSTIGGDGITSDEYGMLGFKPMNTRYAEMGNADYNIIWGGTNDCYASGKLPLGTINDTTNLTFYGSLKILIEGLIRKYPTSKICFLTPLQRTTTSANSYGKKLIDYVNAIIEVCEMYGVPYLDLYRKSGCYPLIKEFKNANLPDGLHPNQSYYYIIAYKIAQFIKSL